MSRPGHRRHRRIQRSFSSCPFMSNSAGSVLQFQPRTGVSEPLCNPPTPPFLNPIKFAYSTLTIFRSCLSRNGERDDSRRPCCCCPPPKLQSPEVRFVRLAVMWSAKCDGEMRVQRVKTRAPPLYVWTIRGLVPVVLVRYMQNIGRGREEGR